MNTRIHLLALFTILTALILPSTGCATEILEASGVIRSGDKLLMVSDDTAGVFYETQILPDDRHINEGLLRLDPSQIKKISIPGGNLASDFESIDLFADGRVAVLSEHLRALIKSDGSLISYDSKFASIGNRGLEGLAIRPKNRNEFLIAVLWEGGFPVKKDLPDQLKKFSKLAFCPEILVHEHQDPSSLKSEYIRAREPARSIPLHVPTPSDGQRFRAPDLVWYPPSTDQKEDWGFVVLLSSSASDKYKNGKTMKVEERYKYQWLMRFDNRGKPYGDPIDIRTLVPKDFKETNWEGLAWYEEGKRLVLVYDTRNETLPKPLIVDINKHWAPASGAGSRKYLEDIDPCTPH